jgi:hypothetical protein
MHGILQASTHFQNILQFFHDQATINSTRGFHQLVVDRSTLDIPLDHYHNSSSPVKDLLKVYVYETLPANLSTDLEFYMADTAYDNHFATDLALFNLFRTFPGRTFDPNRADIFVVPYSHLAHCAHAQGYGPWCNHLPRKESLKVFQYLTFYNDTTKHRHLFFLASSEWQAHKWLIEQPLLATYGPKRYDGSSPPGHVLISQFNPRIQFQPSVLQERRVTEPSSKNYSLTFAAGGFNGVMGKRSGRRFRRYLYHALKPYNEIGAKPFLAEIRLGKIENDAVAKNTTAVELLYREYYPNSVLCPVLPGDCAWQRRFFDVMMSDCLPMVVSWTLNPRADRPNETRTSWYTPEGLNSWGLEETYPFMDAIDYHSFTVQCPGNETHPEDMTGSVSCLETTLADEALLLSKQVALRREMVKVSYGLGPDAHRYEDAFAQLIRQLRKYVDDLEAPTRAK